MLKPVSVDKGKSLFAKLREAIESGGGPEPVLAPSIELVRPRKIKLPATRGRKKAIAAPEFVPYWKKLRDPRWQKRRLKIMERDAWTCQHCGAQHHTLEVHHLFYIRDTEPWDYPDEVLITLCEFCHEAMTTANRTLLIALRKVSAARLIEFADLLNTHGTAHGTMLQVILALQSDKWGCR